MEKHENDRLPIGLAWWEKVPLALATTAQSVVVGLWYYRYIDLRSWQLNIAIAVIAGLALDAIVVTTVMGRRVGRNSKWSAGASFGAFVCSALIAIDSYSTWLNAIRPLLHVSYPAMVLLYSQHLATRVVASQLQPQPNDVAEVAPPPQLRPALVAADTATSETAAISVAPQQVQRNASPLDGVDVAAQLENQFGGNKTAMAKAYGVSPQAIRNRLRD